MATLAPSRLKDVADAANFVDLTADNFTILAAEIGKREPTYVNGVPNTIIGPPTTGAHVDKEFFRDSLGGEYRCTAAGTPGTWRQIKPAFVTSDPVGVPTGYWITRTDLGYDQFLFNGSTWDGVGTIGPQGDPGTVWYSSTGAPAGGTGIEGDWALDTQVGAGLGDVYEKTGASTWTLRGNIRGPTGPTGPAGELWFSGNGAPAGGTGVQGDWYLDHDTGDVYEKTGVATWTLRANIKGPSGVVGEIPSSHVEILSPVSTTSATLEDVPGMSVTITLGATAHIMAVASFEVETQSGGSSSTIAIALQVNGVDHQESARDLSGTSDTGIGAITHRTDTPLAPGTYTVKLRFRRSTGSSTPGINNASLCVIALQGPIPSAVNRALTCDATQVEQYASNLAPVLVTSNRTYYVSTTGSDGNDGLSASTPFLTIQKAADTIRTLFVPVGTTVTIQLADGTYSQSASLNLYPIQGGGYGYLKGNTGTPANVVVSSGAAVGNLINVRGPASTWFVQDLTLSSAHGASLIRASFGGNVFYTNVRFGTTSLWHLRADFGGIIFATGAYEIFGSAAVHAYCEGTGSVISISGFTITITGTPAWSTAFAQAGGGASIRAVSNTFSGAATGKRYDAFLNGVINVNGGGASYLPGNSAGTTATGGQYA